MLRRFLWNTVGVLSTVLGLIGLVLPIIPGVLFLLLAAWCFSRAGTLSRSERDREYQSLRDELRFDLSEYRNRYRYRSPRDRY